MSGPIESKMTTEVWAFATWLMLVAFAEPGNTVKEALRREGFTNPHFMF